MIKMVMDDGQEITLHERTGTGSMEGLREDIPIRIWSASTKWNTVAFGVTEEAAIAALYNKLHEKDP